MRSAWRQGAVVEGLLRSLCHSSVAFVPPRHRIASWTGPGASIPPSLSLSQAPCDRHSFLLKWWSGFACGVSLSLELLRSFRLRCSARRCLLIADRIRTERNVLSLDAEDSGNVFGIHIRIPSNGSDRWKGTSAYAHIYSDPME